MRRYPILYGYRLIFRLKRFHKFETQWCHSISNIKLIDRFVDAESFTRRISGFS